MIDPHQVAVIVGALMLSAFFSGIEIALLISILVYRHDIDNIVGYYHARELCKRRTHMENILRPLTIVLETKFISDVQTLAIT